MKRPTSIIAWRGDSLFNGQRVMVLVTGILRPSNNVKTGPMAQAFILSADKHPLEVRRTEAERSICGDCRLMGLTGHRLCYVSARSMLGMAQSTRTATDCTITEAAAHLSTVRGLRVGAYGDPAAVPFEVWKTLVGRLKVWTGYTHAWRTCDQRFRELLMASVETVDQAAEAAAKGWRYFRIRGPADDTDDAQEITCPAENRGLDCLRCKLCCGTSRKAKSIVITAHGQARAHLPEVQTFGLEDPSCP